MIPWSPMLQLIMLGCKPQEEEKIKHWKTLIRNHTFSLLSSSQCKSTTPSGHLHVSFVNTAEDGTADTLHWGKQFTNLRLLESVIEVLLIRHTEIGKCVANVRTNQRPRLSAWWARQPMGDAHLHTYVCNAFSDLSVSNKQYLNYTLQ